MWKTSLIRLRIAELVAEMASSIRLLTRMGLCAMALVILTLLPLCIYLWELAL